MTMIASLDYPLPRFTSKTDAPDGRTRKPIPLRLRWVGIGVVLQMLSACGSDAGRERTLAGGDALPAASITETGGNVLRMTIDGREWVPTMRRSVPCIHPVKTSRS
jgi:hypothetical protein